MPKDTKDEDKNEKPIIVRNTTDLQRLKLEKLMKNPDKQVIIPERPKERGVPTVPDFVRNVMGSSAGAGSGEFHVYRHLRRKEYARQKYMKEKGEREQLEDSYHQKLEENKRKAEELTAKKRAKRLKKKQRQKNKAKKPKVDKESEPSESSEPSDDEDQIYDIKDDKGVEKIESEITSSCENRKKEDTESNEENIGTNQNTEHNQKNERDQNNEQNPNNQPNKNNELTNINNEDGCTASNKDTNGEGCTQNNDETKENNQRQNDAENDDYKENNDDYKENSECKENLN